MIHFNRLICSIVHYKSRLAIFPAHQQNWLWICHRHFSRIILYTNVFVNNIHLDYINKSQLLECKHKTISMTLWKLFHYRSIFHLIFTITCVINLQHMSIKLIYKFHITFSKTSWVQRNFHLWNRKIHIHLFSWKDFL